MQKHNIDFSLAASNIPALDGSAQSSTDCVFDMQSKDQSPKSEVAESEVSNIMIDFIDFLSCQKSQCSQIVAFIIGAAVLIK